MNSASSSNKPSKTREAKDIAMGRAFKKYNEQLQEQRAAQTRLQTRRFYEMGSNESAKLLDQHCEHCGVLLVPKFVYGMSNRLMMIWPDCNCDPVKIAAEKLAESKRKAELDAKMQLYQSRLDRSGLVGWMRGATFDNYESRPEFPSGDVCKKEVMEYCKQFLDGDLYRQAYHVPNGEMNLEQAIKDYHFHEASNRRKNWLVMYGNFGNGKSHLAAALVKACIDAGRQNIFFRVWPEYLDRLKETWDKENESEQTQAQILAELRNGDLVVIDDLDKEQPGEWVRTVLYKALNHRYNEALPTVLTFNFSPTDRSPKNAGRLALQDYLGSAVIDRFLEVSNIVEFSGPSYRSDLEWSA